MCLCVYESGALGVVWRPCCSVTCPCCDGCPSTTSNRTSWLTSSVVLAPALSRSHRVCPQPDFVWAPTVSQKATSVFLNIAFVWLSLCGHIHFIFSPNMVLQAVFNGTYHVSTFMTTGYIRQYSNRFKWPIICSCIAWMWWCCIMLCLTAKIHS